MIRAFLYYFLLLIPNLHVSLMATTKLKNLTVTQKMLDILTIGISINETRFIVLVISKLIYFLPRFSV